MRQKIPRLNKKSGLRESQKDSKSFLAKPPFLNVFYASLLINTLTVIGVLLLGKRLPPQLPLFYGLPEGQEQLTSKFGLVTASFSAFAIVIINAIISSVLKNDFLRKTLIIVGFVVSVLALITTIEITLLVSAF